MKTIFVSSTFRDFQQERDALRNQVLPRLNQSAKAYGETVDFCDLRWGIDTSSEKEEEDHSETVLSVCLNEIDRTRPYMIVLLGERYGYIPGKEAIKREADRRSLELKDLEISVTALEIEYGALDSREDLDNTFFYFRELDSDSLPAEYRTESAEHAEKLAELKERVRQLADGHVRFYKASWDGSKVSGLEPFAEMVSEDISKLLQTEWEEYSKLDPYQRDSRSQWNYLNEKARVFCAREKLARNIIEEIENKQDEILAVTGAAGSGKSTLFAEICADMRKEGWTVLPFACGNTMLSTDAYSILKSEVWQLETLTGQNHLEEEEKSDSLQTQKSSNEDKWRDRLEEVCALIDQSGRKILIGIDAIDQLNSGEMRDRLHFLPSRARKNVKIFCTCLDTFNLPEDVQKTALPDMNREESSAITDSILKQSGKQLNQKVKDSLLDKTGSENPLFLYLAVSRLTLMNAGDYRKIQMNGNDMEAITEQQMSLVSQMPDDVESMSVSLLHEVGLRVDPKMTDGTAEYLAVSRHGLRTEDLNALLKADGAEFNTLKFAQLVNFMNEMFLLRADGRYDFLHRSLREGLLAQCKDEKSVHIRILTYLKTLPMDDPIRIQEITYHCLKSEDQEFLLSYLISIKEKNQKDAIEAAAADLRSSSETDNGQQLCAFIEWADQNMKEQKERHVFLSFFLFDLYSDLSNETQNQRIIRLQVMNTVLKTAEHSDSFFQTAESARDLSICYGRVGDIYKAMGGSESLQKALEFYNKDMELSEQLDQQLKTADSKQNLSISYMHIGDVYLLLGGIKNFKMAESFIMKIKEI